MTLVFAELAETGCPMRFASRADSGPTSLAGPIVRNPIGSLIAAHVEDLTPLLGGLVTATREFR